MSVSQADFTRAMMDAHQPVPPGLIDHLHQPAEKRFDVYRNNIAVSLREALHSAFPVIAKLLGKENMDGLCSLYLRTHPPTSPVMMFYGEAFPQFLASVEQLSHLGYLGDVARLELALRHSYHAADRSPIAPADLAALRPEALMQSRLRLAPAVRILRSDWPLHAIWRFNTEAGAQKPQPGGQDVLIMRPDFDPVAEPLRAGDADWLQAIQDSATLGEAQQRAEQADPSFDLTALLALLLQGGAITQLDSERETP